MVKNIKYFDRKLSLRTIKNRNKAQCHYGNGEIFRVNAIGNVGLSTPDKDLWTLSPSKIDTKMSASLSQSENCRATGGRERQSVLHSKDPSFHKEKKLSNLCNTTNHKYSSSENQGKPLFQNLYGRPQLFFYLFLKWLIFEANFWIFIEAKGKRNSRSRVDSLSFEA